MVGRRFSIPAAWAACWLVAAPLWGQVARLPAVMPPSEALPATYLGPPDSPAELPQIPQDMPPPGRPVSSLDRPPDARDGFFQKLIFSHEWLLGSADDGMGVHDFEFKTVLALPIPSRNWPLLITPGFAAHFLKGPVAPDMPPQLYDAYTQFRSLGRINPRLGAEAAVTLGVFSDLERSAGDAFRATGHAAAMWEWTPTAKLLMGAAYINTHYSEVIPIGGIIWKPHCELTVEAVFPRPKVARRVYWRGEHTEEVQDWFYLAGEWGNDVWAIRRADGSDDEVNYRDWRLLLGLERKAIGRVDTRFEIGYVFSRDLHYRSTAPTFGLSDTFLLRTAMTY